MDVEDLKNKPKKSISKSNINVKKKVKKDAINASDNNSQVQKYKLERNKKKKTSSDIIKILKSNFNKYKKIIYIIIAIIVIVCIVFLVKAILYNIRMGRFKKYEDKMDMYALSSIYNNQTSKTDEYITKIEGIKTVIASIFNTDDISGFAKGYYDYEDETWVRYAEYYDIIEEGEINKNNKDERISYRDLVKYFSNARGVFLDTNLSNNGDIVLKDAAQNDTMIQIIFSDFVANGIIETEINNIDANQEVFKGLSNELVVNFLEKLFTVSTDKARIRYTEMPKSSESYPYILFDVPTKVYDYSFVKVDESKFENPKEYYKTAKKEYSLIKQYLPSFLNELYTVDYTNLKADTKYQSLNFKSESTINLDEYKEYCNYAIKNKIKTEMDTKIIEPCIYFDGEKYRVRVEAKLKIISAETRDNLLFGDSNYGKITYPSNEYTFYFDVSLGVSDMFAKIYVRNISSVSASSFNKDDLDIKISEKEE